MKFQTTTGTVSRDQQEAIRELDKKLIHRHSGLVEYSTGESVMPFTQNDFACRCGCGQNNIQADAVILINAIETRHGQQLTINSGYRCPAHNRAVGGTDNSQHVAGRAADITSNDFSALQTLCTAMWNENQIGGLGIYIGRRFVHVDTGNHRRWNG